MFDSDIPIPRDYEAEYSIIYLAIEDNSLFPIFEERVTLSHFFNPALRPLWKALVDCYKATGNTDETRCSTFLPAGCFVNPSQTLFELGKEFPFPIKGTEDYWLSRLETAAFRREMLKSGQKIAERALNKQSGDDEAGLLAEASKLTDDLAKSASCGDLAAECRIDIIADRYLEKLDEYARNPDKGPIATGLKIVNQAINGGFNRQEHYIVGARPGMGKTAFALWSIAWPAADAGKPTVIFSLEMSKEKLTSRLLAALTGIPQNKITKNELNLEQSLILKDAREYLKGKPLYIIDAPFSAKQIAGHAKRMKARLGLELIVTDYIQLLNRGGVDAVQETTQNVATITLLAKECDCPAVSLSQLNRGVEGRQDKRPMLSDFAWSDRIVQDASAVFGLYRDYYYNDEADSNRGEILVLKNRHGRENLTLDVGWNGEQTRYYDLGVDYAGAVRA